MSNAEQIQTHTQADGVEPGSTNDAVVLPLRPVADLMASTGPVVIRAETAASQRDAA